VGQRTGCSYSFLDRHLVYPLTIYNLGLGFLLALLVAAAAWYTRALTRSGAVAAVIVGSAFFGLGGWDWSMLLLAFFISSSLLSRLFKRRKLAVDAEYAKGSQRDAGQVLANGGVAAGFVILHAFFPAQAWPWLACAAALAAANADTWATELGILNPWNPILITTGKPVERGTSGGVSLAGTLAALAGASLIGLLASVFDGAGTLFFDQAAVPWHVNPFQPGIFLAVSFSGLFGSLIDSFLGGTLQATYRCPACGKETERYPRHSCGTLTHLVRGLAWLNNDWVNAACTSSAAVFGLLLLIMGSL
jgi:uncharacterized protein (TIGR00297 family)